MRVGVGAVAVRVGVSVGWASSLEHADAPTTSNMNSNRGGTRCTSTGICIACRELYHRCILELLDAMTRKDAGVVKSGLIH